MLVNFILNKEFIYHEESEIDSSEVTSFMEPFPKENTINKKIQFNIPFQTLNWKFPALDTTFRTFYRKDELFKISEVDYTNTCLINCVEMLSETELLIGTKTGEVKCIDMSNEIKAAKVIFSKYKELTKR